MLHLVMQITHAGRVGVVTIVTGLLAGHSRKRGLIPSRSDSLSSAPHRPSGFTSLPFTGQKCVFREAKAARA